MNGGGVVPREIMTSDLPTGRSAFAILCSMTDITILKGYIVAMFLPFLEFYENYELSSRRMHTAYICKILYEIAKGSWFMDSRLRILELEDMGK